MDHKEQRYHLHHFVETIVKLINEEDYSNLTWGDRWFQQHEA